jgi:porphobilinogen synthase
VLVGKAEEVLNDPTVDLLVKMALLQAEAGVDMVAPSDMMDGRVREIREGLDRAGFPNVSIHAYTAKYASALYAPFRDALSSNLKFGDKRTYQLDPANRREALIETALDEMEGADILMVKPALPYLDVIAEMRGATPLPISAYQVSGEYAMIVAAAQNGWIDEERVFLESLLSIKRAGADMIFTYAAPKIAKLL